MIEAEPIPPETEDTARQIVDAAYAVHVNLGPGLLESIYEVCLEHELLKRGRTVRRQVVLPVVYDGLTLDAGLRIDLLVDDRVIVELKCVGRLLPVHYAQVLSYLKLTQCRLGFLINFHTDLIKKGIKRLAL